MLRVEIEDGIGSLVLSRPEVHNAFHGGLIQLILDGLDSLEANDEVRVVVLRAAGRSFCAGADLAWMKDMVSASVEENVRGALRMAALFRRLNDFPKPVVARVQGAAIGGGVGLVSCVDIAVASSRASFGLSEVHLGLAPAVISPFVVAKIGEGEARRYFLTGERFGAFKALQLGLVHEVVPEEDLDGSVGRIVENLMKGGPQALAASKRLAKADNGGLDGTEGDAANARVIAGLRVSDEGQEGLGAFFEKRQPEWANGETEA